MERYCEKTKQDVKELMRRKVDEKEKKVLQSRMFEIPKQLLFNSFPFPPPISQLINLKTTTPNSQPSNPFPHLIPPSLFPHPLHLRPPNFLSAPFLPLLPPSLQQRIQIVEAKLSLLPPRPSISLRPRRFSLLLLFCRLRFTLTLFDHILPDVSATGRPLLHP